jgi:hypothetical protein
MKSGTELGERTDPGLHPGYPRHANTAMVLAAAQLE